MYTKYTTIILGFALLLISSCNKYDANGNLIKDYDELEKASFLIGNWQKIDSTGTLEETWKTENDSTFLGTSYFVQNKKDTLHSEQIELVENNKTLFYTATVKGENNNQPTSFQLTEADDSLLVFENPKHDFPQKITYKLQKNNTLRATVSGIQFGKSKTDNYTMSKVN
jgi:hypothetical protein